MNKLLTVVVPVYKVEKYIKKCLDSLVMSEEQQKVIEVIIVNDGTPDNSAIIAKEYEKRFPDLFKVIDKENGGHGSAWNKGVELATGKYIRFLDSDDWLTNFEDFLSRLSQIDVDLVFSNMTKCYQATGSEKKYDILGMKEGVVYNADKYDWSLTNVMLDPYSITNFQTCTYKTELIKKYAPVFLEKQFYDDEILYVLPLLLSKNFVFFDIVLYNYFIGREGQTVNSNVYKKNTDSKTKVRKQIQEFVNSHPVESPTKKEKIDFILNERNYVLMNAYSYLSYNLCKGKVKSFIEWLNSNQPDYKRSLVFQLNNLSSLLYWLLYHFVRQLWLKFRNI